MEESDKRLKFIRDFEKLLAEPVKAEGYESPLEKENLVFKGSKPEPEPVTRIKTGTPVIDTKSPQKLLKGEEFAEKIKALTSKKDAPEGGRSFAQTRSKMMPVISNAGAISDLAQGNYEKAADTVAGDILQNAPSAIAKGIGKVAPKLAGAAIRVANPIGMVIGEALGSEKAYASEDSITPEQQRDVELVRGISENDDEMNTARFQALKRMIKASDR